VLLVAGADAWHTSAIPRLGIPAIKVTDGPNGARGATFVGTTSACFPCGTALGATWDPELVQEVGAAIGEEARTKQARVLLAPTVNIHRHPLAGRNFECYSEDPFLSSRLAVAFVRGVQSQSVAATVKHFVCNDSEFERMTISSEVGERALREIYLPPFDAAVHEGGAWAVMTAYNRINGTHACQNVELVHDLLKEEWGFDGLVISDWWGTRSTVAAANAGLDLEMPGPAHHFGSRLLTSVDSGDVSEAVVDDKVRRLLRLAVRTGAFEDVAGLAEEQALDRTDHRALIRRASAAATVLLTNDGILPLDRGQLELVAIIGPNADVLSVQGGGSARVEPHHSTSVVDALKETVGPGVEVRFEPGCRIDRGTPVLARGITDDGLAGARAEYFDNADFADAPAVVQHVRRVEFRWLGQTLPKGLTGQFTLRATATFTPEASGAHHFTLTSAGLSRLLVDRVLLVDNWTEQRPGRSFYGQGSAEVGNDIELEAGRRYEVTLEYQSPIAATIPGVIVGCRRPQAADLVERAVALAAEADVVVLVAGSNAEWESEGSDRVNMQLPGAQDELIERVAAANARTVVVVNAGSPVSMPWAERVAAILQLWYPGQEGGEAVADVLFGAVEPGGRLPTTFPFRVEDVPSHLTYPGEAGAVSYGEGIFVGHRGFDRRAVPALFPFGHGLGYTTFEWSPLTLDRSEISAEDSLTVSLSIRNNGPRTGSEVAQVYVRDVQSTLLRPEKELKGFARVTLEQGEQRDVRITLEARAFQARDPRSHEWVTEPGDFEIMAGASSADVRARAFVTFRDG
jgi:beta-glucosidase